jgi:hypothetical protein
MVAGRDAMTVSISFLHILPSLVDLQEDDHMERAAESSPFRGTEEERPYLVIFPFL